jgi:hypothetical protein
MSVKLVFNSAHKEFQKRFYHTYLPSQRFCVLERTGPGESQSDWPAEVDVSHEAVPESILPIYFDSCWRAPKGQLGDLHLDAHGYYDLVAYSYYMGKTLFMALDSASDFHIARDTPEFALGGLLYELNAGNVRSTARYERYAADHLPVLLEDPRFATLPVTIIYRIVSQKVGIEDLADHLVAFLITNLTPDNGMELLLPCVDWTKVSYERAKDLHAKISGGPYRYHVEMPVWVLLQLHVLTLRAIALRKTKMVELKRQTVEGLRIPPRE